MFSMDAHSRIPSVNKLHLIMFMQKNGIITFKEQNVYKCNRSFKKAMKELHDLNLVLIRQLRTGNQYKLTNFGENLGMMLNELAK